MFLGLVFWQWLLIAAVCFVVTIIGAYLECCVGYKSTILRYIGKIITYFGSGCTSFSAIIGMMLVVLTIVKSFF